MRAQFRQSHLMACRNGIMVTVFPALHHIGGPMDFVLQPWHVYLLILVGWVQRQQQEVIHYLITENQVLKEQIGKKRILLNDDQRRRLAVKGKVGGAGGQLETGRVLDYLEKPNRKMCSLYLSMLDKCGIHLAEFGDSKERLAEV